MSNESAQAAAGLALKDKKMAKLLKRMLKPRPKN